MTIQRKPMNIIRQSWPKRQPRIPKPPKEFPEHVKDIMWTRSGGVCELDSCGPAEVYHHRRPRGNGGSSLDWVNRAANGLALSDSCHMKVEGRLTGSSRAWSTVQGWLVSQNGTDIAADVHVLYRGRYVLLADDGRVRDIEGDAEIVIAPAVTLTLASREVPDAP